MKLYLVLIVLLACVAVLYMQPQAAPEQSLRSSHSIYLENTIATYVNSAQNHWKAGRNNRWDVADLAAIKHQMGTIRNTNSKHGLAVVDTITAPIPDTFDPRDNWPNCDSIKEIRDQSNCGSCWAFGAAEALTDRWCIHSEGKSQDRLSSEDLLTCCDTCGFGCNGGEPPFAWAYFTYVGISTGGLYNDTNWCRPYHLAPCDHHTTGKYTPCPSTPSLPTPACAFQCNSQYQGTYEKDLHRVKFAYTISKNI